MKTNKEKIRYIEIECAVARWFDPRECLIVPNIAWGFFWGRELDMMIVRKTGYVTEVEIKMTFADYKNDFNKNHNHNSKYIKDFYYAFPEWLYEKRRDDILALLPDNAGVLSIWKGESGAIQCYCKKRKKSNCSAVKLNESQVYQIARLGTMRIWTLKNTLREHFKP